MSVWLLSVALLAQAQATDIPAQLNAPIELRDGDRVLMLGDALFERDHDLAVIETTLTARYPDRAITFRNLGWTGDTVWGDSRAAFETAKEGFERRAALLKELKPTVLLIAYGMNESFAGEAGLPRFEEGLRALLESVASTGARIVLVSPIVHENLGPHLPDPNSHNKDLIVYRDAIGRLARERGCGFVDLIRARIGDGTRPERIVPACETIDGIHLNAYGYNLAAIALAEAIGPGRYPAWQLETGLSPEGIQVHVRSGARVLEKERVKGGWRVRLQDDRLPNIPDPAETHPESQVPDRTLIAWGLATGRYALCIDGKEVARADEKEWADGVRFAAGPEFDQLEQLRQAIVAKNRLLFYRWRPENQTYIYGFRKHEQGQNAVEIPRFDALVAEKEAEITRLKVPVPHTYELIRVEELAK
jgi:lysophospholipase L1-like esterase